MPTKKTTTPIKSIIETFVGKIIIVVLKGVSLSDEHGETPMVCEGVLFDFDDKFILIGNEHKTAFSLLSYDSIVKIDLIDESEMAMMEKPDPSEMN